MADAAQADVQSADAEGAPLAPEVPPAAPRWIAIHVCDAALPLAIALWAIGISQTHATTLGPFGLPAALPVIFYAGIVLLVLSAVIELAIENSSQWRMALHAVALVVMLYGPAALVYQTGRYSWLYKTIGVIQYVAVHGQLNHSIDIYQNWPGFFALAAWFDKVAGVSNPLGYAKWAQLVFELAALPLLYLIYDGLTLTYKQRWMALLLYPAANWIGQDYLSPQGLGTVLSLGIMALTMRWLYTGNRSQFGPRRRWLRRKRAAEPGQVSTPAAIPATAKKAYQDVRSVIDAATIAGMAHRVTHTPQNAWERLRSVDYLPASFRGQARGARAGDQAEQPAGQEPLASAKRPGDLLVRPGRNAGFLVVILLLFFVLTSVHELSPYIVAVQLIILALSRPLRPRWLPLVMLAIAIAYLLPRLSFVESHYGLLSSLGSFFGNVTPPSATTPSYAGSIPASQLLIQRCAEGLSVLMWLLALIGAWRLRHSGRIVLALLVLTFSPILVLFGQAYGNEGILRVYLFSLPWAAALAAAAVEPGSLARGSLPRAWSATVAAGRRLGARTRATLLLAGSAAAVAGGRLWAATRWAGSAAAVAGGKLWVLVRAAARRVGSAAEKLWALVYAAARRTGSAAAFAGGKLSAAARAAPLRVRSAGAATAVRVRALAHATPGRLRAAREVKPGPAARAALPRIGSAAAAAGRKLWALARALSLRTGSGAAAAGARAWIATRAAGRRAGSGVAVAGGKLWVLTRAAARRAGSGAAAAGGKLWALARAAARWAGPAVAAAGGGLWALVRGGPRRLRAAAGGSHFSWVMSAVRLVRAPVALCVVLALFFVAFYGDDAFDAFSATEVNTIYSFLQHARPGPLYVAEDNVPADDTDQYYLFPGNDIFGSRDGAPVVDQATPDIAAVIAQNSLTITQGRQPAYVLITPSMAPYNSAYAQAAPDSFTILEKSLAASKQWKLVASKDGTIIYEFPPAKGA